MNVGCNRTECSILVLAINVVFWKRFCGIRSRSGLLNIELRAAHYNFILEHFVTTFKSDTIKRHTYGPDAESFWLQLNTAFRFRLSMLYFGKDTVVSDHVLNCLT